MQELHKMHKMVEEGIVKLREVCILDWIYCMRPENALPAQKSHEGPELTPFSKAIRNAQVRRISVSLRISVIAFFCRLELMVP